jgi:hypothetical protein
MMGKQIIVDIVVVVILPALLIGGYYLFKNSDDALLSFVSPTTLPAGQDLGAKTKNALILLRSIPPTLDQSLFNDPAYLMLKDYQVTIPTISLGRVNPFTPPAILENISRSTRNSTAALVKSVTPISPSAAAKIDLLKKSGL